MKKKLLVGLLIPSMLAGLASCGDKGEVSDKKNSNSNIEEVSSQESSYEYLSISQEEDVIGLIPEEVLNAQNISIDILEYIEGQNGTIKDIGAINYKPEEIEYSELAKYYAAAKEFKKLAPGVKINLIYCNINDYVDTRRAYNNQKGHLPHIMHSINEFQVDMQAGLVVDLSKYETSEYYQAYNDDLINLANWGGFQAAFPTHIAPYGMFVNKKILNDSYIVDTSDEDAYKNWVDELTYEKWVKVLRDTYVPTQHAGIGQFNKTTATMLSYMDPKIYKQYAETGTIDLNHSELEQLLALENEASQYSIFDTYNPGGGGKADDGFNTVYTWAMTKEFVNGMYTFDTHEPWNLNGVSQLAQSQNKSNDDFDYLPYPKMNDSANNYIGLRIGGLEVGNQCPIGTDGREHCSSENSHLEEDIAAYFCMFLVNDPRAIKSAATIKYNAPDGDPEQKVGVLSLPLCERDFKFSWQLDEETLEKYPDPAADYGDNFEYQLSLWFKTFPTWWDADSGEEPDVTYYSNINYGFATVLSMLYNKPDQVIDVARIPEYVADVETEERSILQPWEERYKATIANPEGGLGSATYVSDLLFRLSDIEDDINSNAEVAKLYLQELVDLYYGEGKYQLFD